MSKCKQQKIMILLMTFYKLTKIDGICNLINGRKT